MSKVEKRNTMLTNSAAQKNREVSKGTISYILPREGPNQDEAQVSVEIRDIRFGQRAVGEPEVTTIVNGSKTVIRVPFSEPLNFGFKRVEDDMVFKFAVTSAGDLLGFIYMEIPQKFKTMKSFRLDDWFPIKHLETEQAEDIKAQNFVARILVNYKATRKLDTTQPFTGKLPKAQLYEEMARNLKQKIGDIHAAVDAYNDDGFKHLANFEKKLLKKKIKANAIDSDPKKTVQTFQPARFVNTQKDHFYKTRNLMADVSEVRNGDLTPGQFYNLEENKLKNLTKGCTQCEKMLKELSYSRKELIEANQRLTALEEGLMTVDNVQLKRQLERAKEDVAKDRKELNVKLKEQNLLLGKDRENLKAEFEREKSKAENAQLEANSVVVEYRARLKNLEERENQILQEDDALDKKNKTLAAREAKLATEAAKIQKERADLTDSTDEINEIKSRMMLERQRIHEESGKYVYSKGDLELKEKQLKILEDFLNEEKEGFRKEVDRKNAEIDNLQKELKQREDLFSLEATHLKENQEELDRRTKEFLDEKKKLKIETVRVWREKNRAAEEIGNFLENKKLIDNENTAQQEEMGKDYEYIDEQLELIEKQKVEFDELREKLESFEHQLEDQNRAQREQQERFAIMQRQFFERLGNSQFDIEELKRAAEKFNIDFSEANKKFGEHQKITKDLEKQRSVYKRNIDSIVEQQSKEGTIQERRTNNQERRNTRMTKDNLTFVSSTQVEQNMKIKQDAHEILDRMFSNVTLKAFKKDDRNKDALIDQLFKRTKELEEELLSAQKDFKKYKLSHFLGGEGTSRKNSKVVQNPFLENSKPVSQRGSHNEQEFNTDEAADQNSAAPPLKDLQTDILDLCDACIDELRHSIDEAEDPEKVNERILYLQNSKRVVKNIFKVLEQISAAGTEQEGNVLQTFNLDNDDFDNEKLRRRYEQKIKGLVDYIQRIRECNDFFNTNIDNDILVK